MNFNQSHDPSDALGEEEPRRVSDVVRHPEYRADPIGAYQCDLALLLEACDDRAFDDLASSLQQMKTTGAE